MKLSALGIFGLATIGAFGCASDGDVDIGDDHGARLGTNLSDYAGSWDGYVEAFSFPDGSDRIRINLDSQGRGGIELGNDAPALPAPDPEQAPPGFRYDGTHWVGPTILTGYPFSVTGATIEGKRIKFATQTPIEYQQWCGLQSPTEGLDSTAEAPIYRCVPSSRGISEDHDSCHLFFDEGPDVAISCGKVQCVFLCTCTASTCTWNDAPYTLDAALEDDGEKLVGTLVGGTGRVTVRLERL